MARNTEALGSHGQYEVIIGTLKVMGLLAITSARRLRRAHGVWLSGKALGFPGVASAVSVGAFGHTRGALMASIALKTRGQEIMVLPLGTTYSKDILNEDLE